MKNSHFIFCTFRFCRIPNMEGASTPYRTSYVSSTLVVSFNFSAIQSSDPTFKQMPCFSFFIYIFHQKLAATRLFFSPQFICSNRHKLSIPTFQNTTAFFTPDYWSQEQDDNGEHTLLPSVSGVKSEHQGQCIMLWLIWYSFILLVLLSCRISLSLHGDQGWAVVTIQVVTFPPGTSTTAS